MKQSNFNEFKKGSETMNVMNEVLRTILNEPLFLFCLLIIIIGLSLYFLEYVLGTKKLKKRIEKLEKKP